MYVESLWGFNIIEVNNPFSVTEESTKHDRIKPKTMNH